MIRVVVRELFHKNSFGVWIIKRDEHLHRTYVANPMPLIFTEKKEGYALPEPTFELNSGAHRELLDGLAKGLAEAGYEVKSERVHGERHHGEASSRLTKICGQIIFNYGKVFMIHLLLVLAIFGFIAWLILKIPMPAIVRNIIIGVMTIVLVVWALQTLGFDTGFRRIRL